MCAVSGPQTASVSGLPYIGTTLHSLTSSFTPIMSCFPHRDPIMTGKEPTMINTLGDEAQRK